MSEAVESAAPVTEQPANPDSTAFNQDGAAVAPIKDPNAGPDVNMLSRHQRLQRMVAELDAESDREANEKILGRSEPKEADNELEAGVKATEDAEESRREARRTEGKAKEAEELATEPAAEEQTEAATEDVEAKPEDAEAEAKPAEEEKPKEDLSKLEKDRRAKFEKVLAMEAKARQQGEKLRAREDVLRRNEVELQQRAQQMQEQFNRRLQEHERDIGTAREVLRLARENPLELLERSGAKPEDVAKWIEDASNPTLVKMRQMEARLEEERRARVEQQRRADEAAKQAEAARQRAAIENEYLGHFEEKGDDGEYAFEPAKLIYSRSELIRLGDEIANEAIRAGYQFTARDIADAVNELAKDDERYKVIQRRYAAQVKQEAQQAVPPATAQQAAKPAPAPAAKPKPTTVLTNKTAQQTAVAKPEGKKLENVGDLKRMRNERNRRLFASLDRE